MHKPDGYEFAWYDTVAHEGNNCECKIDYGTYKPINKPILFPKGVE
jgi:hypothetical protein